jgi:hypothetical protein
MQKEDRRKKCVVIVGVVVGEIFSLFFPLYWRSFGLFFVVFHLFMM